MALVTSARSPQRTGHKLGQSDLSDRNKNLLGRYEDASHKIVSSYPAASKGLFLLKSSLNWTAPIILLYKFVHYASVSCICIDVLCKYAAALAGI